MTVSCGRPSTTAGVPCSWRRTRPRSTKSNRGFPAWSRTTWPMTPRSTRQTISSILEWRRRGARR
ncbi:hypothetical protein AHAS_Ahas19G0054400 [Arachis hypogaea]